MGDSHQAAFRILSDFRKGKCAYGHCLESAEKRQEQKSDIVDIDLEFYRTRYCGGLKN
ncbi:hypothetical protein NC652_005561 [Populus alba x Populus x berolinensis]|nr:hypothetical protein NC652_005561 [Populus alba x Populus x berolinensis]